MNKYLVKKELAKYVRRSLVLLGKEWSEEVDKKNKICFVTELEPEKFEPILNNAKYEKKADDKGLLIISFHDHPKKPGVIIYTEYIDGPMCYRRIDTETKERLQKFLAEEER